MTLNLDLELYTFLFFAGVSLAAALLTVTSKEVIRSVVWLSVSFIAVGALYLLLSAEFLFIIQVLVYVGAVSVVILFGVMLTRRYIMKEVKGQ